MMMSNRLHPSLEPEEWLSQRLANTAEFDPHYEASWYGPYNALLSHYFPYQQRFLIKPQPKIREASPEDADVSFSSIEAESSQILDEHSFATDPDLSMTSMGGFAMPGGSITIPDFIVAKATEFASHDEAPLLVEIKLGNPGEKSNSRARRYQLDRYMNSLADQMLEDAKLVGLMICGTDVTISRLHGVGSQIRVDKVTHDINSTTIRQLLLDIAKENWDY